MSPSSIRSLLGVLLGFACTFPLFLRRPKKAPAADADTLLQQAQQEMREAQARNRERAVQVITQKSILQARVDQTQKLIAHQTERLESAEFSDDAASKRKLSAQRDKNIKMLPGQQAMLSAAVEAAELVKNAMRQKDRHVRQLTAEALAMKAQEKMARIELEIASSKVKTSTPVWADLFAQARKKIE